MRNFIFFILFLFPIVASAQFPANPRKMRLGYQTTADGLIYRASGAPNFTPADSDDARVYIDTETGDLYVYNSGWIKTARKTDAITRVDTVNQINHGFSVGDPLWKSGDYVLARDTGLSVTVSGVVIDSFDANTFYVQRNGVFTLTGHGFTVDQQLYVQPDGSYSTADTSNSLVYGFAIDANTIQIGATTEGIRAISNYFDNSLAGRATTKQAILDSLAGFQSFQNISAITAASPSSGYMVEDRSTGIRYRVTTDTIAGLAVDNNYQRILGGGKYLIVNNEYIFTINNQDTPDSVSTAIFNRTKAIKVNITLPSNATSNKRYTIPSAGAVDNQNDFTISVDDRSDNYNVYVIPASGLIDIGGGRFADSLFVDKTISIYDAGGVWKVKEGVNFQDVVYIQSFDEFSKRRFYRGQKVQFRSHEYTIQSAPINLKTSQELTPDSVICIPVRDAATWSPNLIPGSSDFQENGSNDPESDLKLQNIPALDGSIGCMVTSATGAPLSGSGTSGNNEIVSNSLGVVDYTSLLQMGDTITISTDLLIKGDSSTIYIGPRIATGATLYSGSTTYTDTENQWVRTEVKYVVTGTIGGNIRLQWNFDIGGNDTINISRPKFEISSRQSDYTITAPSSSEVKGQLYAVLSDLSYLPLDDLNFPSRYNSNSSKIQKALDLQKSINNCAYVWTSKNNTIDDPVVMDNNNIILGPNKSKNSSEVTWTIDINDSTKDALTWLNVNSPTNYPVGNNVSGIAFDVISPARSVIEMKGSLEGIIERVAIRVNSSYTLSDSLLQYGISSTMANGLNGIYSRIKDCIVEDTWDWAYYIKEGKFLTFTENKAIRAARGLYFESPGIYIQNSNFENIVGTAIFGEGGGKGFIFAENLYFESIGETVGGVAADANAIHIDASDFNVAYINNITLTATAGYAGFKFRDVSKVVIDTYNKEQANWSGGDLDADCSNGAIQIRGIPGTYIDIDNDTLICSSIVSFDDMQRFDGSGVASRKRNLEHIGGRSDSTYIVESLNDVSAFTGSMAFDNNTVLKAYGQNWIKYSESLFDWSDVGAIALSKNDTTINSIPFHKVNIASDPVQSDRISVDMDTSLSFGQYYQVSIDVYPGNNLTIDSVGVQISDTNPIRWTKYTPVTGSVTRVYVNFKYQSATSFPYRIRIHPYDGSAQSGDSLRLSRVQLSPIPLGYNLSDNRLQLSYVKTTGSEVYDLGEYTLNLDDDMVLNGNVEITGTLLAEKYRTFTPIIYDNIDTLLVDRLELGFESLKITDELDGLEVKQVTFTTDRNVTADTQVRLEYFDISASTYTSFGSGTIINGTNQITVTGLTQSVTANDIIYMEVVTAGGEANGISATLKLQ